MKLRRTKVEQLEPEVVERKECRQVPETSYRTELRVTQQISYVPECQMVQQQVPNNHTLSYCSGLLSIPVSAFRLHRRRLYLLFYR